MDPFPPTEQQRAVIEHRNGNLLVFAGPGTGKTETLARRFAALVGEGVAPNGILVLTFSRRAADEMRDRVLLRLRQTRGSGLSVSELFVRTFHGFCGRLLDGDDGRLRTRALLTPVKERLLWREVMRKRSLPLASFDPSVAASGRFATDCLNIMSHLKGQGVTAARLADVARGDARLSDIAALFAAIEVERERSGLRDYRDLVNDAVAALRRPNSPALAWLRAAGFAHVLVDEFQDSDPMQLQLLETMRDMVSPAPLFCFVGDVNQSIYRFRGASPANVEAARTAFRCEELPLHDNRRSAQAILDVANADASLDPRSQTSAADAARIGGVRLLRPRTTDDEVREIRDAVVAKVAAGIAPSAIAVLLRTTQPYQELIADALAESGVPVAALPAAGFHEDALVDAILTAVRLLAAPADNGLWRRLLGNPIIGFRPIDVRAAFDAGRRAGMTDARAMLHTNAPRGVRPIGDFLTSWSRCSKTFGAAMPEELVRTIVDELDLLRPVRERDPVSGFHLTASLLRLDALLQAAEDYSDVAEFVARLDETIGLLADDTQPPLALSEGVRVMSIHAAKGLEFDFVVIPQLIDGMLPADARSNGLIPPRSQRVLAAAGIRVQLDEDEARQEEHSLWYVALTRARSDVLATAARVDDEGVELQLSPFAAPLLIAESEQVGHVSGADAADGRINSPATTPHPPPAQSIRLPIETLSPSGISDFIACPRRFFYRHVVRLPARDDDATRSGVTLHRVLRRFHEIETNFEHIADADAAAARYRTTLRQLLAEEAGASGEEGERLSPLARFERNDLERRLALYAEHIAVTAVREPFSVLACERDVVSPAGGIALQGRVDRIDRLGRGGLAIRDYKLGRWHGSGLVSAVRRVFERIDAGETIFGDVPDGLNLQTILYIPGVERAFGDQVMMLDYLYFRGRSIDDGDLLIDTTRIAVSGEGDEQTLSRSEIDRVERDIALQIFSLCSSGELTRFPTAHDERTCAICSFTRICPGPGAVA